jgi:hypothetical protein
MGRKLLPALSPAFSRSAEAEVQAEGHRCNMLRSVPATKQNDPIRYSQLLMLPLDVWDVSIVNPVAPFEGPQDVSESLDGWDGGSLLK